MHLTGSAPPPCYPSTASKPPYYPERVLSSVNASASTGMDPSPLSAASSSVISPRTYTVKQKIGRFFNKHSEIIGVIAIVSALAISILAVVVIAAGFAVGLGIPGILVAVPLFLSSIGLFGFGGYMVMKDVDEESSFSIYSNGHFHLPFGKKETPNPAMELYLQNNFNVKRSKGDGNCLFRSISHHINRLPPEYHLPEMETNHENIRSVTIEHIRSNPDLYQELPEKNQSLDNYIARMSRLKTWGGQGEVVAFVRYMEERGTPIQIHVWDVSNTLIVPHKMGTHGPVIHIRRIPEHFDVLNPIAPDFVSPDL